jgi:hypothetical protein
MANDYDHTIIGTLNHIAKSISDLTDGKVEKRHTVVGALQEVNVQIKKLPPK